MKKKVRPITENEALMAALQTLTDAASEIVRELRKRKKDE